MKGCSLFLILSLLAPLLGGCDQWGFGLPKGMIAQVNEESISIEEFNREFRELILGPEKELEKKDLETLRKAYLDQIIERKILAQEAKRLGMEVSQEELNQAISEIKTGYSGEGFGEKLSLKGITLEDLKTRLKEKLLAEKLVRTAFHSQEKIDEREALKYYEEHRSRFQVGEKVRVRQIVVADGEEAIQILKRLKKGESFEKIAREKSLGPEKVRGGDLGYFARGEKPPEFDVVFNMEVGTISEVIKSPYGYHLFKLEEKIGPRQIPYHEAKAGILQELEKKKGEENYQKWYTGLRAKAKVKINKKWIRS